MLLLYAKKIGYKTHFTLAARNALYRLWSILHMKNSLNCISVNTLRNRVILTRI